MIQKITYTFLALVFALSTMNAQETWGLEKCVSYAQENNLSIQQADYTVQAAALTEKESKNARLPNINGFMGGDVNFGRTINPVTNEFDNQRFTSSSLGISAGMTLYNGNRIKNTITQSQYDLAASEADQAQMKTNIALQVAAAYLQVLFSEEQLANAKNRLQQTQNQLEQTDKLIQAGTLPRADRLEIMANIARDEQSIVIQDNNVTLNYLTLKQLLQLEPDYELTVEKPTVIVPRVEPESFVLKDIYNKAYNNQPIIRAGEMRLKSSELGVDIAKSLGLPSLGISANVNSFWSDRTLDPNKPKDIRVIMSDESVEIDGVPSTITRSFLTSGFENRSYFGQISDNFGQGIGLNLNVPIYNGERTSIAKQRAEIGILNQRIINNQNEQVLKADIQRAIADAKAAKKQFEAADKTVNALKEAYTNTEKRYQLGAINTFEYTTSKNTLDQADVDLIIAKYNYLYTVKVVDFYEGNKLTLK